MKSFKVLKFRGVLIALFLVVVAIYSLDAQCVMCRATAGSSEGDAAQKFGEGLNTGILYLMAIPYILLIGSGVYFFKIKKKKI